MNAPSEKQRPILGRALHYLETHSKPQAMIFFGASAAEHENLVRFLIATLFCKTRPPGEKAPSPCGHCPSCKKIISANHPDFLTLRLQENASIGIEEIRNFIVFFNSRPFVETRKIGFILNAEALTPQAAAALLKIIEEPPRDTLILLSCLNHLQLLPTIRSRSIPVHIPRIGVQELQQPAASETEENETVEIPKLLQDASLWKRISELNCEMNLDAFFELSESLSKHRNLGLVFLKAGKIFFSDLIQFRILTNTRGIPDERMALYERLGTRWTNLDCSHIIMSFENALKHLEYNTPLRLIIEEVLAQITKPRSLLGVESQLG